ncbi:radical SAM protein [Desulfogranum marinum]|uniref:radical SAM protein n=1 Tax=Desulfogranum marinum TaxID=453220 RepID=UPI0019645EDB|nr:radical SAM protein [Desulfogranum marinum]MBM9512293.1 radical SAM protein [Desulfogranum marinum]
MALSLQQRNRFIQGNQREFGNRYEQLFFPDEETLSEADKRRRYLLQELAESVSFGCLGTKLDMSNLSPGCRICIEGQWSCLFINGKCNGNCFYCPTSQDEIGLPTTNTLTFQDPKEYAAYLQVFGFKGTSISGGEPLLTLDKTVRFIRSIKNRFGGDVHVWLYTNGILATREIMKKLADAGLNEIRFDIGATGYRLRQLDHAVGIIPTVTVEIPAVPEESERMINLLPSLYDCGVQHLNLHQLRLTPYNFKKLVTRGYRFLHGKKMAVLDSELAALEILLHGKKKNINLPINYCSFPYKDRFQALAARRRNGTFILKSYESLTENGFIRTLMITGNPDVLSQQVSALKRSGNNDGLWKQNGSEELSVHINLLPHIDFKDLNLQIAYSAAYQRPSATYRNPFTKVTISRKMNIVIERETSPHRFSLSSDQASTLPAAISATGSKQATQGLDKLIIQEEMIDYEYVRAGLADYY